MSPLSMMQTVNTPEEFQKLIDGDKPTMAHMGPSDSDPPRVPSRARFSEDASNEINCAIADLYKTFSRDFHQEVNFVTIDMKKQRGIAEMIGTAATPIFVVYLKGEVIHTRICPLPHELEDLVMYARALNKT